MQYLKIVIFFLLLININAFASSDSLIVSFTGGNLQIPFMKMKSDYIILMNSRICPSDLLASKIADWKCHQINKLSQQCNAEVSCFSQSRQYAKKERIVNLKKKLKMFKQRGFPFQFRITRKKISTKPFVENINNVKEKSRFNVLLQRFSLPLLKVSNSISESVITSELRWNSSITFSDGWSFDVALGFYELESSLLGNEDSFFVFDAGASVNDERNGFLGEFGLGFQKWIVTNVSNVYLTAKIAVGQKLHVKSLPFLDTYSIGYTTVANDQKEKEIRLPNRFVF